MSLFSAVKVSFRVAREETTKKERILICYIFSIYINKLSFRGLHKLQPRPDWSHLGVKFKISDEHPRPFHMGVPLPGFAAYRSSISQSVGVPKIIFFLVSLL